jgi:hypothetical protein
MSSLFPHVLLVFQQYPLQTTASTGIVLHTVVVENVCECRFDLVVVVADLVICGIGGISQARQ